MPISARRCLMMSLLATGFVAPAMAQSPATNGAAGAISDAVQEGTHPYRPPSGASTSPEENARARCEALKEQYNAASRQRSYSSPGAATQTAQGRTIPKIERDKTREELQQAYRDNCT